MASNIQLFSFCLCVLFLKGGTQLLRVNVTQQGDYSILWKDNTTWLHSAPTFFVIDNKTYSANDSSLTFLGVNTSTDTQSLTYTLSYQAGFTKIMASVKAYNTRNLIDFTVTFPEGANGTKVASPESLICAFPAFRVDSSAASLAYLSFGMPTVQPKFGRWEQGSSFSVHGGRLGSGPLVLFDRNSNAVAMGPSQSFTVTSLWYDPKEGNVYWGMMGSIAQVPVGFRYGVALAGGEGQIGKAMSAWAQLVRSLVSKKDLKELRTITSIPQGHVLDRLGYWTGPGSAYYAAPEAGKTYEDTLIDVRLDAFNETVKELHLEYGYVEIDDWWYEKGANGGVKNWTSPASVFPDGVRGMANETLWLVAATCGVWARDNVYAKQNGGNYTFLVENDCALPNDQAFWNLLLDQASEQQVRIFVQKDMDQQYLCMTSGDSDVDTVSTWMTQLNVSVARQFMDVLYSGAIPRLVTEAAFRHVTLPFIQVGSGNVTDADHWKVGVNNIFLDAVGLRPFFGVIQSYRSEPASDSQLPPSLYSLLATLTGGPVAIGDEIGKSDRQQLIRCCSADGRILHAAHPAKAIDAQLQQMAWKEEKGPTGEIWTTFTVTSLKSDHDVNLYHGIIVASGLTQPYDVTPSSAGFLFTSDGVEAYAPTKIFKSNDHYHVYNFSDDNPFKLTNCTIEDYCLYHVAPVFKFQNKELVLMGELTKWVPMSPQRMQRVEIQGSKLVVQMRGLPDEKVYLSFHVNGRLEELEHRIELDGTGQLVFEFPFVSSQENISVNFVIVLCALSLSMFLTLSQIPTTLL